jgi:hypothetical protein
MYTFPGGTSTDLDVPRLRFRAAGETADTVGWSREYYSARIVVERRTASNAQLGIVTVARLGQDDGDTLAIRTLTYRK